MTQKINIPCDEYYSFPQYLQEKGTVSKELAHDLAVLLFSHDIDVVQGVVRELNSRWESIRADIVNSRKCEYYPPIEGEKDKVVLCDNYESYIKSRSSMNVLSDVVLPLSTYMHGKEEYSMEYYSSYVEQKYDVGAGTKMNYHEVLAYFMEQSRQTALKIKLVQQDAQNITEAQVRGKDPKEYISEGKVTGAINNVKMGEIVNQLADGTIGTPNEPKTAYGNRLTSNKKGLEINIGGADLTMPLNSNSVHRIVDPYGFFQNGSVTTAYAQQHLRLDFTKNDQERYDHFIRYLNEDPEHILRSKDLIFGKVEPDAPLNERQKLELETMPLYTYYNPAWLLRLKEQYKNEPDIYDRYMNKLLKTILLIVPGGDELCITYINKQIPITNNIKFIGDYMRIIKRLHYMVALACSGGRTIDIDKFVMEAIDRAGLKRITLPVVLSFSCFKKPITLKGKVSDRLEKMGKNIVGAFSALLGKMENLDTIDEELLNDMIGYDKVDFGLGEDRNIQIELHNKKILSQEPQVNVVLRTKPISQNTNVAYNINKPETVNNAHLRTKIDTRLHDVSTGMKISTVQSSENPISTPNVGTEGTEGKNYKKERETIQRRINLEPSPKVGIKEPIVVENKLEESFGDDFSIDVIGNTNV